MRNSLLHSRLLEVLRYESETGDLIWLVDKHKYKCKGKVAGFVSKDDGYRRICIDTVHFLAHRLVWFYVMGSWPAHFLDHKDMDRSNNRFGNLREVTNKQNMENKHTQSNCTSGFMGVTWDKRRSKWYAHIKTDGIMRNLGFFHDFNEAKAARLAAERKYFTHSPRVEQS
jgi:hypothetical protein